MQKVANPSPSPHTHMYNTHIYMCLYAAVYHIDSLPGARTEYTEITSNKDVSEQKFWSPGEAWEVVGGAAGGVAR